MQKYELVFILDPKLDAQGQKKETDKLEKLITSFKGEVKKKDIWGKRTLAYPIKKFIEGIYIKFDLNFLPENIKEWEKKIKLEKRIIRYLLIKVER